MLGVIVMLLVVLCIALALDTGRLYMEKRNLQRVADLIALSVVSSCRYLDACDESDREQYALEAAQDNDYALELDNASAQERDNLIPGQIRIEGERYSFDENSAVHDAVKVELSHQVPTSLVANLAALMPGSDIDPETSLRASAVARQRNGTVTFSVGSGLLKADESGLLKMLLGNDAIVDALSYEGLINVSLSIANLIDLAASAGSKDGLLQDVELELDKVDVAGLEAVSCADGSCDADTVASLQIFKDAMDGFLELGLEAVKVGDLLAVDSTTPAEALQAEVGLQSLLHTMVLMGNGQFLDVDNFKVNVGALTNVELLLDVIESPRIAVGQAGCLDGAEGNCQGEWITEARTVQLRVGIAGSVRVPLVADVNLKVGLWSAGARAGIEQVKGAEDDGYELTVSAYNQPVDIRLGLDVNTLSGIRISSASWSGSDLDTWLGMHEMSWKGSVMNPDPGVVDFSNDGEKSIGFSGDAESLSDQLANALSREIPSKVVGILLKPVNSLLSDVVAAMVLNPLLGALGVQVGMADVRIIDVEPSRGGGELVL
nr:pilus assembly protein TadG-related protein [Halomonas getboli]